MIRWHGVIGARRCCHQRGCRGSRFSGLADKRERSGAFAIKTKVFRARTHDDQFWQRLCEKPDAIYIRIEAVPETLIGQIDEYRKP